MGVVSHVFPVVPPLVQIVVVQALSRFLRFPPHSTVSGHTREGLDRGYSNIILH